MICIDLIVCMHDSRVVTITEVEGAGRNLYRSSDYFIVIVSYYYLVSAEGRNKGCDKEEKGKYHCI